MVVADIGFAIRVTLLVSAGLLLVLFEVVSLLNAFHLILVLFVVVVLLLLLYELEELFSGLHF